MSPPQRLADARVVLTGASSGIGWALANQLAAAKARVIVAARSVDQLQALCQQIRSKGGWAESVPTDVTSAAERSRLVAAAVSLLGGLDVVINNAGVGASGHFGSGTEECLRRIFEINFFGATELTRLALPHLRQGRQPMIVNVSSVIGRRAIPGYTEYCASKFALCGWSEALRAELAVEGIHVLLVNPGLIETPFRDHLLEDRLRSRGARPRAMSPTACARAMVQAMRRRKNELTITASGKLLVWINRLAPGLVDRAMESYARGQTANQPATASS